MRIPNPIAQFAIRHDLVPERILNGQLEEELELWKKRGRTPPTPSIVKQEIVRSYAARFQLKILVETGTYFGAMVSACKNSFTRIYSVELQESFAIRASKRFSSCAHISIFQGDSATELPKILAQIDRSSLFWLDAHYSDGLTARGPIETPIMTELELIFAHPVAGHVILIDDARCFDGSHDYPGLSRLVDYGEANGSACEVKDDVIRMVAKKPCTESPGFKNGSMLILHAAPFYPPEISGVSEVLRQLSTRLARRGHEVHVATARQGAAPARELCDGVSVHRFAVTGNSVYGVKGAAGEYLEFVRSRSWDAIAMHCAQTWTTDLLLPRLKEFPAAKVFVGHGLLINDPIFQNYYDRFAQEVRNVNRIVSLSPLVEVNPFCAKYGLGDPEIIPNGVDLSEWNQEILGVRRKWKIDGRPFLLCVSNHYPIKGHGKFFEVVRAIRKRTPSARGVIVGRHARAWRYGLGRVGVQGGCSYRCRVAARFSTGVELKTDVPRAEVISAFQEADMVLIPSSWEASPLTVLESMAAGTPWISFDVGCARENAGGIVVGSAEDMVGAARELLSDPERRRLLGAEGRKRIALNHDWDSIVTQYEQLYQSILDGQCKPSFA